MFGGAYYIFVSMLSIVIISILTVIVTIGISGKVSTKNRLNFSWNHLWKGIFFVAYTDGKDTWTINITYGTKKSDVEYVISGDKRLLIYIPKGILYSDFIRKISELEIIDPVFFYIMYGLKNEQTLGPLSLSKPDIDNYREFKRHFLLKVL